MVHTCASQPNNVLIDIVFIFFVQMRQFYGRWCDVISYACNLYRWLAIIFVTHAIEQQFVLSISLLFFNWKPRKRKNKLKRNSKRSMVESKTTTNELLPWRQSQSRSIISHTIVTGLNESCMHVYVVVAKNSWDNQFSISFVLFFFFRLCCLQWCLSIPVKWNFKPINFSVHLCFKFAYHTIQFSVFNRCSRSYQQQHQRQIVLLFDNNKKEVLINQSAFLC